MKKILTLDTMMFIIKQNPKGVAYEDRSLQ